MQLNTNGKRDYAKVNILRNNFAETNIYKSVSRINFLRYEVNKYLLGKKLFYSLQHCTDKRTI